MDNYGKITQGSILGNIRIENFPDTPYYGIIVTARCDIANCKVPRFHYITAAPITTWYNTEGLLSAIQEYYSKQLNTLLERWKKNIPIDNLKSKSPTEIIEEIQHSLKQEEESSSQFEKKKETTINELNNISKYYNIFTIKNDESKSYLNNTEIKRRADNILSDVIHEKRKHYCFLPFKSYMEHPTSTDLEKQFDGLIVNLLDICILDYDTAEKIEKQELDYDKLSEDGRNKYNKQFFLDKDHTMIFPEQCIKSPYVEWLMQQFSNAFIRIGIDTPDKTKLFQHWNNKLKTQERTQ